MDIVLGDKLKRQVQIVMWYLRHKIKKEHGATSEMIHDDMLNCGNPVIAEIMELIRDAGEQIEEEYQRGVTIDFPEIVLWVLYRDTAYLPVFMYILKNLMDKKEELMPSIMKYYKEPKDWYVNAWHRTKEHTQELKDEGKLENVDGALSYDEQIFVPELQKGRIQQLTKDIETTINKEKKKRGWR